MVWTLPAAAPCAAFSRERLHELLSCCWWGGHEDLFL